MGVNISSGTRSLIWVVVIGFFITYLSYQLRIVNDIGQFMPTAHQGTQLQALINEMQNGPAATTLMLRLSGAENEELAELSIKLNQL